MPNHITNKVSLKGDTQKINEVIQFVGDKMDFNKIIPMPEELEGTQSPSSKPNRELIKKYGYDNWYDWRCANWGTKWNAYNFDTEDCPIPHLNGTTYEFFTAWSAPEPILFRLSEMFPDVEFELSFADEDMGYNCGIYTFLNGDVIDQWIPDFGSREATEFACELQGCDVEDYWDECGSGENE